MFSGFAPVEATRLNIVFHGNSLVEGTDDANIVQALSTRVPESTTATITALGTDDATWQAMPDGVDTLFVDEAVNVLFVWETLNTVVNDTERAITDIAADVAAYIALRRAAHPGWRIVMITTLPRELPDVADVVNNQMVAVDNYFLQNYRLVDLDGVVLVRRLDSPFCLAGYDTDGFAANDSIWAADTLGNRFLPSSEGYALIAEQCYETLRRFVRL